MDAIYEIMGLIELDLNDTSRYIREINDIDTLIEMRNAVKIMKRKVERIR